MAKKQIALIISNNKLSETQSKISSQMFCMHTQLLLSITFSLSLVLVYTLYTCHVLANRAPKDKVNPTVSNHSLAIHISAYLFSSDGDISVRSKSPSVILGLPESIPSITHVHINIKHPIMITVLIRGAEFLISLHKSTRRFNHLKTIDTCTCSIYMYMYTGYISHALNFQMLYHVSEN